MRRHLKNGHFGATLLALCVVFQTAAFAGTSNSQKEKLTFCRGSSMMGALPYIAEKKGFFEKQNLDINFISTTNGKLCQDLVIAGKADLYTTAEAPISYIAASKPPLSIVAFLQRNPEISVFARKDRGITSFADLRGKKVAYLPGTISFFFLARLLEKLGMTKKDLSLVPMQPPLMSQALVGGAVDAIVIWEPWGSNALTQLGENGVHLADSSIYEPVGVCIATKAIIQSRPEVVQKLLAALIEAESFSNNNRDESIALLSEAIPIDAKVLATNWPQYINYVTINVAPVKQMQDNFSFLTRYDENFAGVPAPDFRALVDDSPLKAVAPDRVQWPEQKSAVANGH